MAERVEVEATGQAHVAGQPDLPSAVVHFVDPWGNVQFTYRESVLYGLRLPTPDAFVRMITYA